LRRRSPLHRQKQAKKFASRSQIHNCN
jgi:hypothetical protein